MQKGLCLELATNSYHSYGRMKKENRKLPEKSLTLGLNQMAFRSNCGV